MRDLKNVLSEITDDIGIIRIDNPPGNFLERPEFIPVEVLEEWILANSLKGILITGAGKHFSGGAGLDELFLMAGDSEKMIRETTRGKLLLDCIANLTIPVIAAINGTCFGGGLEIALACHIRISSEKALFAFPEVNHGFIPGLGGIGRMTEKSSLYETISLILGGDMINAEEALSMKIVDRIVPAAGLFDYSFSLLKKMTSGRDLKVIHSVMKSLHNTRTLSREEAIKAETKIFCELAERSKKNEK